MNLCTFHLQLHKPPQQLLARLDHHRVLIVNPINATYIQICPDKPPKTLFPGTHFIVTQECACSLRSVVKHAGPDHQPHLLDIYLPPSLSFCKVNISQPIILHPINMAIALTFFNITHTNVLQDHITPLPAKLPDLNATLAHSKFHHIFLHDTRTKIDMKKARSALFNEHFDYLPQPSEYAPIFSSDFFRKANYYLVFSNTTVLVILVLLVFRLYTRHSNLGMWAFLAQANRAPQVAASNFNDLQPLTFPPPATGHHDSPQDSDSYLFQLIAFCLFIYANLVFLSIAKSRNTHKNYQAILKPNTH